MKTGDKIDNESEEEDEPIALRTRGAKRRRDATQDPRNMLLITTIFTSFL